MDNGTDADAKVAALVKWKAREDAESLHLRECPDLTVEHPDAYNGTYGCDTGCEYARLEADLSCPHGERETFEYGEFGDIADLLREMSKATR
jgi:hypothetical protein